jgi:hypothetical protein
VADEHGVDFSRQVPIPLRPEHVDDAH